MEIIYTSLAMAKLGSPMYMTGTDGVAVSTYAFDDFGRNIDPFTGKIKENNKHGYTKQGNIIQPFAFTGYQEDEVSGLKFAQARFYSAEKGRFVGEDQVGGFTESPDTQNKFIYCWNDPKKHVDRNGKFPQIIAGVLIGGAIGAVVDAVSQGVAIAKGEQESFDWGKLAGATVEGAVVGGLASTGLGACFAGSMLSGGVGALAGNVTTQLINTGTVDAEEARNATAAGIIGGAIGYGIGKVATKVAPKVLPKIASKVDDFAAKVKAFRNGGSVEAIRTEKPMFEYNLQFFAEKGGGCPYENSTTSSKLYSFGNKTAPRGARPMQDFGVESFDSIVKAQSGPLPSGASNVLDVADAPLSGHFHMLPEGTSMPDGLGVIADGVDIVPNSPHGAGHHTIYPTKDMTVNEFNDLYKSLPWEYGGKK